MIANALYSILTSATGVTDLVGTRIYPQVAPQNAIEPYIIYARTDTEHHEGFINSVGLARGAFEITAWSQSYDTARAIAEQIRLVLEGYVGTIASTTIQGANLTDDNDFFNPSINASEPGHHSVEQTYALWFGETIPT